MKNKLFFAALFALPLLSFINIDNPDRLKQLKTQALLTDSIIFSYRAEWKEMLLNNYKKERLEDDIDWAKSSYGVTSLNLKLKKRITDSLLNQLSDQYNKERNLYSRNGFTSKDKRLKIVSEKKWDCMNITCYVYSDDTIKIISMNYDTLFEFYYQKKGLYFFVDDEIGSDCKKGSYMAKFYFDKNIILNKDIKGVPSPSRNNIDFGNRYGLNIFSDAASILDFSKHLRMGQIKNVPK